ncbi:hypothetical protein Neosp_004227 [[Neocosmospora] mangrovei]
MTGSYQKDDNLQRVAGNLLRLCGSDNLLYAQLRLATGLTRYQFLDRNETDAAFVNLDMNVSCTDDPPQSDSGYLYAMYSGANGKKDVLRREGEMEVTYLECPCDVAHFSVSQGYIIVIDPDGHIYTRDGDNSWTDNIDPKNHTNSRIAAYRDTYYQSCSIDWWGSVYIYDGSNSWKKIDGNNKNRDLVAGPDWLLTRYPNGKTWKWDKSKDKWEALSGDEDGKVVQLVASATRTEHIYRLFDDGTVQCYNPRRKEWYKNPSYHNDGKNTWIAVDDKHLYRVTDHNEGFVDAFN